VPAPWVPLERVMNFDGTVLDMPKALNTTAQGCRACEATLG